ncbi:MAG: glycosyltransferase [Sulfurimonas sp.]
MQTNLAPIIIFVYNRLGTVENVIRSLKVNKESKYADLIIYSDAWKDITNKMNVQKVRNYIKNLKGFKSVKIIERHENYGLAKNIIEGVTDVINKYGKVIVLEDDLVTSKNFLCYMNQSLDFYENDKRIFAISGYTGSLPSLESFDNEVYLSYRPSSWGWATWKEEWVKVDWDVKDFNEFIRDKHAIKKFNRGGIDMTRMLKHCMEGKNHSWAIRWSYFMYKQGKYCVYPKKSKVQNIGFGEDATNCKGIDIYQTNLDNSENCNFKFTSNIKINNQLIKEFAYVFSYTNKAIKRIKNYIPRFIK